MVKITCACIGTRRASNAQLILCRQIGQYLARRNWVVKSGNCIGPDRAFAIGANAINPGLVEIYQPWESYNNSWIIVGNRVVEISPEWYAIAEQYHPAWDRCSQGVRKLMARNVGVILGSNLVMACRASVHRGGTEHAIDMAEDFGVPVVDITIHTAPEIAEIIRREEEKVTGVPAKKLSEK